jgi:Large ribosomal RNA subunit accumulation protein YceD
VVGWVSATVDQACVVTLEPMQNEVEEDVDLIFSTAGGTGAAVDGGPALATDDASEPLQNGVIDLGGVATEFLILAVDPYPRRPGAEFKPRATGETQAHPFAALAALKKPGSGAI